MILKSVLAVVPSVTQQLNKLLAQQEATKKVVKPVVKHMYDASNTLKTPIIDTSHIDLFKKAEHFFDTTDKIINWITHPILIMHSIAGASLFICGIICLVGVLYYLIGNKKGMKVAAGSVLGYFLIKVIDFGVSLL